MMAASNVTVNVECGLMSDLFVRGFVVYFCVIRKEQSVLKFT